MKKLVFGLMSLLLLCASVFAQSDLQPLAVVKLNKNESITVKQLKSRCEIYQKQMGRTLTLDEKKSVLDTLIEEKLVIQAAQKAGLSIPDSVVDQYFIQSMSQSLGTKATEKQLYNLVQKTYKKNLNEYCRI